LRPEPIPGRLNLLLAAGSMGTCLWLLWVASHTSSWVVLAGCAVLFSFVNNTVFALFHEAEHKILHPNEAVNEWAGRLLGAFFPTSLGFHRAGHLNHHAYNRSEFETFDYIRPGENLFLKYAQWYAVLTGIYWLTVPVAALAYLVWPGFLRIGALRDGVEAKQTAALTYARAFERAPTRVLRLEILGALLLQLGFWTVLDLNWCGWLACYLAFAWNWGSLQYADHAFSDCDTLSGAWNLRVHPVVRAFFLNYHYHRAHHENPKVPWLYLDRYLHPEEFRPWFGDIYRLMWKGPRPLPADGRSPLICRRTPPATP
jgi:fatty acid desaturase